MAFFDRNLLPMGAKAVFQGQTNKKTPESKKRLEKAALFFLKDDVRHAIPLFR
jgi:hypothetical protein